MVRLVLVSGREFTTMAKHPSLVQIEIHCLVNTSLLNLPPSLRYLLPLTIRMGLRIWCDALLCILVREVQTSGPTLP